MTHGVSYEFSDKISTLTLDDGKVNCLSPAVLGALSQAFDQAEKDKGVVVLLGREGKFSAGFDLEVFKRGGEDLVNMLKAGAELALRILSFPKPVVVACSGHALAMGAFLMLCADVRIGAEGPFKIGLNEVAIGLTMPHFGVEIARQRLTPAEFNRAVVTARIYSPEEAVRAGFLDELVPAAKLKEAAREMAVSLGRLDLDAHEATKKRTRARAIEALEAALRADFGEL